MPVLPEFMPEGKPGEAANAFAQGRDEGESWMTMEQNRQIQAQRAQQEKDEFIAKLPVVHAQAQADVATANASIALGVRMQNLRTQAGVVAPTANNEFLDAMHLADPQSQFDELGMLQAKYAWMKNLPEYHPFLDAMDKARGDAFHLVTANNLATSVLQRTEVLAGARTQAAETAAEARRGAAEIGAGARIESSNIIAGSREKAAETAAASRLAVQTEKNAAAEGKAGASLADLQAREDAENQAAQEALTSGDEELAKFHLARAAQFHDAAVKASTYSGSGPSEPAPKPSSAAKKLYHPPAAPGQTPAFSSSVKTPQDVLHAMQQMVDDGVITPEQARETLKKLGFKPKQ